MLFITDLDRTLIYSHLFLDEAECAYRLIEKKGEKPIAYMSEKAITLLERLHQVAHIVPITLRNEEEFHRIDLFKEKVIPEFFVTNNGGTIYYKGKEDMEYTQQIQGQMESLTISHEMIKTHFLKCYQGKIEKVVNCGDLVWLFMGQKDQIDEEGITIFKKQFATLGWQIDVSGRKIYVYPYFVTKWKAATYIQNKYYHEPIFAAGDSIFDREMVEKAERGMIPKKCYIEESVKHNVLISEHAGLRAAEDILKEALAFANELHDK